MRIGRLVHTAMNSAESRKLRRRRGERRNETISSALEALYAGDREHAEKLLAPDEQLAAYEAAAFGRVDRLRTLLDEDPGAANSWRQ